MANITNLRHGHRRGTFTSRTYLIWRHMKGRCRGQGRGGKLYVAKGITCCERWSDFKNFLQDMGECPSDIHTIDRIRNEGNYEPSNCRWATPKEQQNNRTNNVLITCAGETLTLSQWAERLGMNGSTLFSRYYQGYPTELIFSKQNMSGKRHLSKRSS